MLFSYKYVSKSSKKTALFNLLGNIPLFLRLDLYYNSINNIERIRDMKKKNTLIDIVKIILTDIMQYLELIKILQKMN